MAEFSTLIFRELDDIGYRNEMIMIRRNFWQEMQTGLNTKLHESNEHAIFAGSKAEGITSLYQSDVDTMCLITDALCTDNVEPFSHVPDMTVIYCDMRDAPPGYTRLKLISSNGRISRASLRECTFKSESGDVFLSSALFATSVEQMFRQENGGRHFGNLSGPAVQYSGQPSFDSVIAFSYYYPRLLQTWRSRRRLHDWPPADVREDAASMFAQVVPVGCKGSCDQWREWRFCFIESELKLTYSLNETQLKLYIVLKMVAKEILSMVCDEISSYIMKNITFWLSELLPEDVFRKENFITLLLLSLRFLRSAIIKWNWLPYYMIPSRNLLAERLTPANRRQLSGLIENLIHEGPQFILRCEKFRTVVYLRLEAPALIVQYGQTRYIIEVLEYCRKLLDVRCVDSLVKNEVVWEIADILFPEWRMLLYRGVPVKNIAAVLFERIKSILS